MASGKTVEELEALVLQQHQKIRIIRDRLKLMSKFLNEEIRKI
jgi:hypothetical protein